MQIICAWCNEVIAHPADFARHGETVEISHGICPNCSDIILREATQQLLGRLKQLEEPLLLLDSKRRIEQATPHALALLGLPEQQVVGQPLAVVLGCFDCRLKPVDSRVASPPETCLLESQIQRALEERRTIEGLVACGAPSGTHQQRAPLILKTRFLCERVLLCLQPDTENSTHLPFSMDPSS